MDLEPLTVRNARGGCIARPALCLFLYSDKPVHELTSSAADVVAAYLEQVGVDRMSTYVGNNGELRKFTPRKLSQDLRQLRDFPPSLGAAWIEYNSDPDGWAGDHGVLLYATDFQKYEHERQRDNLLRLDFPAEYWKHALDAFIDFVNRVAEMFPFEFWERRLCIQANVRHQRQCNQAGQPVAAALHGIRSVLSGRAGQDARPYLQRALAEPVE